MAVVSELVTMSDGAIHETGKMRHERLCFKTVGPVMPVEVNDEAIPGRNKAPSAAQDQDTYSMPVGLA